MYGGRGSGIIASNATATTGIASTVAGIAVLPNTGGSVLLQALSITTLSAGALIILSFITTRVLTRLYR